MFRLVTFRFIAHIHPSSLLSAFPASESDYLNQLEDFISRNGTGSRFAQDIVPNTDLTDGIQVRLTTNLSHSLLPRLYNTIAIFSYRHPASRSDKFVSKIRLKRLTQWRASALSAPTSTSARVDAALFTPNSSSTSKPTRFASHFSKCNGLFVCFA